MTFCVAFNGNSDGGNAAFVTNAGALVEFATTSGPAGDHRVHAGSIDGAGSYFLGSNRLIVGSNGFNTEASGLIGDGDGFGGGGTGASLVKTGIGKLILSHADNTYTGGTFLRGGILELGAVNAAGTHAINFTRGAQTLQIDDVALSSHTISNRIKSFGFGDAINLHDLAFTTHAHVHYNSHTHKLNVTSGGITDKLVLIHPEATTFKVVNAGIAGGTKIKLVHNPAHANALAAEAAAQKQASDHNSDGHHALMGVAAVFDDSGFQFRELEQPFDTTLDWHDGLASLSFGSHGGESLQDHRDLSQAVSHGSADFQGWTHNLVDRATSLGMHDFLS